MAATGTFAVVPSGNLTVTVEPGSPVPETVNVPFGFAAMLAVGAAGAIVSVNAVVVAGEALPAASVAVVLMGPELCGVAEVTV